MARIFLSYHRDSEASARVVAGDLESMGHEPWLDRELSGGQAWWEHILDTIRQCEIFLFVLSPEALQSTACEREYGYAGALGKPILPVLVSDRVSINLLPPALSRIQLVDYRAPNRDAALRLARALNRIEPPPPLPDPLPPPPEVPISYLGNLSEQIGGSAALSFEAQSALVMDLRRGLASPATEHDTRVLLGRLRQRRDLFATVADEIDTLMEDQISGEASSERDFNAVAAPRAPGPTASLEREQRLSPSQRLRWARNLALAGLAASAAAGTLFSLSPRTSAPCPTRSRAFTMSRWASAAPSPVPSPAIDSGSCWARPSAWPWARCF